VPICMAAAVPQAMARRAVVIGVTLIGDGPQQPGQCSVTGTDWAACRN
jgi:hypothetical protein